jgi:histidinol dehydrogenase
MKTLASVHRFKDMVAVYIGGGETVYLSVKEAGALAAAIQKCKRDILCGSFIESKFHKVSMERPEGRN